MRKPSTLTCPTTVLPGVNCSGFLILIIVGVAVTVGNAVTVGVEVGVTVYVGVGVDVAV